MRAILERFFVKEACLYECEPIAGHYRKFPSGPDFNETSMNTWQVCLTLDECV